MTRFSARLPMRRLLLAGGLAALSLSLAACHRGGKGDDQRTAAGQVLSGSISDAMLPYDTVKSQPPLAPHAADSASDAASAASDAPGDRVTGGEAPAPGDGILR